MVIELKANYKIDRFSFHIKLIDALQKAIIYHMDHYDSQIANFINWKKIPMPVAEHVDVRNC